jgi:hypothetical protein
MKTRQLLPLILLVCATCTARAHLIDLTLGGFNADNGLPEAYFRLVEQTFFDSAAHGWFDLPEGRQFLNGWVSKYGILNGADYFSTNLFSIGDTPFASISWNLAGQPDSYWLTMIYVAGRTEDGTPWEHIYEVSGDQRFEGEGIVTANGLATISQIAFYGLNVVPDGGTTLLLFGLALATFSVWKYIAFAKQKKEPDEPGSPD